MNKTSSQIKTKVSLALFFAAIAIGALLVWFFTAGPSPIELVKPTPFVNDSEVANSAYDQINKKLVGENLLIIGVPPQPEKFQPIVSEFLAQLGKDGKKVLVLKEQTWPALSLPENFQVADFDLNAEDIETQVEPLRNAVQSSLVVIYSVSIYSTHLIEGNAIHRLESALGESIPSITFGQLVLRHDFENKNEPACVGSMRDLEGLYQLGCAQLYNSRNHYNELLPLDKKYFMITEQALGDFLVQLHFPGK